MEATVWTCVRCEQLNPRGRNICEHCEVPRDNITAEEVAAPPFLREVPTRTVWVVVWQLWIVAISLAFYLPFWILQQLPVHDSASGTLIGLAYFLWLFVGKSGKWLILTGMGLVLFSRHLAKTHRKPTLFGYVILSSASTTLEIFYYLGGIFGGVHPGSEGVLIAAEVLFPVLVALFTLYGSRYLLQQAGKVNATTQGGHGTEYFRCVRTPPPI